MAVISALALGVAAIGTASSLSAASKARKKGRQANAAQKKLNRKRNAIKKRAFLRQFQQAQAARLAEGISSGVGLESSTTQGALASQATQAATQIKEFKEFDALGAEVAGARQGAADAQSQSGSFGAVASFASSFIAFGGKAETE